MQKVQILAIATLIVATGSLGFAQETGDVYMWEFNEGSGLSVTDNTDQYSATLGALSDGGAPEASTDSPSGAAGDLSVVPVVGMATNDPSNPLLGLTEGPVTVEAWVNLDTSDGYQDLLRIGNSLKAGVSGGNMQFTLLGVVDISSTVAVPADGGWHHLAYAWEPGAGVSFYFDGEMTEYVENAGAARAFNETFSVGADASGGSPLQGAMDRLRIHSALLSADELDSDAATVKAPLDSTVASYNFDEESLPYESNAGDAIPVISITEYLQTATAPTFVAVSPTGEADDYSMSFDGNDQVTYDDNETFFFDFIDEPFTFEAWMKFKAEDQVASRPILFAYGVGGQGGYSFSFRPAAVEKAETVEDSPSGAAGDSSMRPVSPVHVIDVDETLLPTADGPVTIEAWIKPDSMEDYTDIARIGGSIKAGFAGESLVFTFLGVVDMTVEGAELAADGGWHHVAYSWEPGVKVDMFVDGELVGTYEIGDMAGAFGNNNISIGGSHSNTSPFLGLMDRVRIHKATLGAADLDSDAAAPKEPLADTVVAFDFDEANPPYASATDAGLTADNSGNKLTVTTFGIVDAHSDAEIPDDGLWHHVASVFDWDGYAFKFYVDGELKDTYDYEDGVNPAPDQNAFLYFGCEANGGNPFVGQLDRVKITRDALTPESFDYFEPVNETGVCDWSLF